jgi:hypothetical protein
MSMSTCDRTRREGGSAKTVWREKRRLRQLETEVAQARASQAELQRRLELFEKIAATAGVDVPGPAAEPLAGEDAVPPSLLAAAQHPARDGAPVRIDVEGRELIAVVDGGGDPHEWWTAIRRLAFRLRSAS